MTNKDMLNLIWPDFNSNLICPRSLDDHGYHCPSSVSCGECKDQWLNSEYIPKTSNISETEEEPQFTRIQEERIDEVYNEVFEMCRELTAGGEREVKDDMALLGPLADNIAEYLIQNGYEVYFPTQTTDEKGKTVIRNFYDH